MLNETAGDGYHSGQLQIWPVASVGQPSTAALSIDLGDSCNGGICDISATATYSP